MNANPIITIRKHYFLLIALIISVFLIFSNLDDRVFWGDEAQSAQVSKTILEYGIPTFYDGKNLIVDHPFDLDLNYYISDKLINYEERKSRYSLVDYIWKWQPWVQNYLIASSFMIFGINTFAARFPFAIAGLLTIVITYFLILKLFKNRELANVAVLLLVTFVPFYLYTRQARYYSLAMLFSVLVIYSYLKLVNNEKYSKILFILSNVLLFYSFYISFFGIYFALIIHMFAFNRKGKSIKKFILCSLWIFIFTFPWFLYANLASKGYSFQFYHFIFGFLYLMSYVFFYFFPTIFLIFIPGLILYKRNNQLFVNSDHALLILIIFFSIISAIIGPWELPSFRYISFLIPLFIAEIASIFMALKKYSKYLFVVVLLLFVTTNWLLIFPFKFFENLGLNYVAKNSDAHYYIKENMEIRYNLFNYLYEITHKYRGPNELITLFLRKNSNDNETFISNSDSLVYSFYTNMKFENDINKYPDWIILRKPYLLWGGPNGEGNFLFNLTFANYSKIIINSTDYIYLLDSPEPRKHRFRTNDMTNILDRYEISPIIIYHKNE